jgi:predicted PurR-regulated permease PerM
MDPSGGTRTQGYHAFLLVLLFFSLYLCFLIFRPFVHTIILAVLLAAAAQPLQSYLARVFRQRKTLAALVVMTVATFLIIIPILFLLSALVAQALETVRYVNDWISAGNLQRFLERPEIAGYVDWLRTHLQITQLRESDLTSDLLQVGRGTARFLLERGAGLLGDLGSLMFYFFVMLFLAFYLVRDGSAMLGQVKGLSPLRSEQNERIVRQMKAVGRSVLLGGFLTMLCQGVAGAIGFAIVGIPAFFWGTVLGFSSLVPVVGTALVWIPAVAYLAAVGEIKGAIFLSLWSIVVVGSIDNFLRPFLMRGEGKMSTLYLFLAIIGGVKYFGMAGILYGPLILGLASVMLAIYRVEYRPGGETGVSEK